MKKRFKVHEFRIGDVEDPEVLAAEPLYQWQNTPIGKWVMENAVDTPEWNLAGGFNYLGWACVVTAEFEDERITEWLLRSKT